MAVAEDMRKRVYITITDQNQKRTSINIDDILYAKADGSYTELYVKRKKKIEQIILTKKLGEIEQYLKNLFLMIAPLQSLSNIIPENYIGDVNIVGFAVSAACIVLVMISLWQGIIVNREQRLIEANRIHKKYLELQKAHYDDLIERDVSMRRLRHDMRSHIQVLSSYCEENNIGKIKSYLERMIKEADINDTVRFTGNNTVDAIISGIMTGAKKSGITVKIYGRIPSQCKVEDYDLCIIISNLLKNAVEACEKNQKENKTIEMKFSAYNSQIAITVQNPVESVLQIQNNTIKTNKEDKKNHGLGLKNISDTVEKYDGIFSIRCNNGKFIAEVNI